MNEDVAIFILLSAIYLNMSACWWYLSWVLKGMPEITPILDEILFSLFWPVTMNLFMVRLILMKIRKIKDQQR